MRNLPGQPAPWGWESFCRKPAGTEGHCRALEGRGTAQTPMLGLGRWARRLTSLKDKCPPWEKGPRGPTPPQRLAHLPEARSQGELKLQAREGGDGGFVPRCGSLQPPLFLEKEGLPCRPWEPAVSPETTPCLSGWPRGDGGVGRGKQHPLQGEPPDPREWGWGGASAQWTALQPQPCPLCRVPTGWGGERPGSPRVEVTGSPVKILITCLGNTLSPLLCPTDPWRGRPPKGHLPLKEHWPPHSQGRWGLIHAELSPGCWATWSKWGW